MRLSRRLPAPLPICTRWCELASRRKYQIEWDEWSSVVWMRRITVPLAEEDAIRHYENILKDPPIEVRNVTVREVTGEPLSPI